MGIVEPCGRLQLGARPFSLPQPMAHSEAWKRGGSGQAEAQYTTNQMLSPNFIQWRSGGWSTDCRRHRQQSSDTRDLDKCICMGLIPDKAWITIYCSVYWDYWLTHTWDLFLINWTMRGLSVNWCQVDKRLQLLFVCHIWQCSTVYQYLKYIRTHAKASWTVHQH